MQLQPTPPREPPLLHRIALGDPSATTEFMGSYGGLLWSMARRFESAHAEEAVKDIILDVWRSAAQFDPTVASEAAFVAMIARRRLIQRRRTRGQPTLKSVRDPLRIADKTRQDPTTCVEAARAAHALSELAPELRSVVVLATCHDMSHSEVAAQTGVAVSAIKMRVRSGLRSIRAAVLGVTSKSRKQP